MRRAAPPPLGGDIGVRVGRDQDEDTHVAGARPHQQFDVLPLSLRALVNTVIIDYNGDGQALLLRRLACLLPERRRWALGQLLVNNIA